MKRIILIYGASGSGTTTLAKEISKKARFWFMDVDDYLWVPTNPQYRIKRTPEERICLMQQDIDMNNDIVLSGSMNGWGDFIIPQLTLAIRLTVPTAVRLERLRKREFERFGSRILPGGDMYAIHCSFLNRAAGYDTHENTRNKKAHDIWESKLHCKLMSLDGTKEISILLEEILKEISNT